MRKAARWILLFGVLTAAIYFGQRAYFTLTDGFSIAQITSDFKPDQRWSIAPLSQKRLEQIRSILSKTYDYYGKGTQAYAFKSEDDRYVIKFFKQKHLWTPWYFKRPLQPQGLELYRQMKIRSRAKKKNKIFTGYKLSYTKLQEETGIFYIHLNKSKDLNQKITLIDKLGFSHTIDADQYEFIIQDKMQTLAEYIAEKDDQNDYDSIRNILKESVKLMISRSKKGFYDKDNNLMNNFGVIDEKVRIIDPGNMKEKRKIKNRYIYIPDVAARSLYIRKWLQSKRPHLVPLFDDTIGAQQPLIEKNISVKAIDKKSPTQLQFHFLPWSGLAQR